MKFFTMSFDDGTVQDVRFTEILNQYGLKCTFNLNSGFFGQRHRIVHDGIDCDHTEITADMVPALYRGHEVAVHTVDHPDLSTLSREEIIREVEEDRLRLEALCGYPIVGMAYPGGEKPYNEFVIEVLKRDTAIRYARTVGINPHFTMPERLLEWHPNCDVKDVRLFALAERFLAAEEERDQLFFVWGHSFEFDKYDSWDRFQRFCDLIAGRAGIQYVTNREILAHLTV